jgi:signal transduction histidine kinase
VPAAETISSADGFVKAEALTLDLPRYEEERRRLTRRGAVTGCVLATGIVPLYVVTDYALYPQHFWPLFVARMLSILLGMGVVLLLRRPAGMRLIYMLVAGLCIGLALCNSAVPVYLLGYDAPYYVASILVICGIALLLPWGASQAAALALGLLAMYVVASALHGTLDNWLAFACNLSFVAATVGIALVSLQAGEGLRKREFCARVALRRAYENKRELAAALAEKTAKLEMLNHEMEDLLYAASHDLRAPLINVQGFSRELRLGLDQLRNGNGKSPEVIAALADVDESLQFILAGVARLDGLITSLLNVSRIATRTNPTEEVDLNALLQKLAQSFRYQLSDKNITLDVEPLPVVIGDPARLGQLFGNLIDNAVKYMGNSRQRRIYVGVRSANGERRFFVQDTGPGIAKESQEQIFRVFRRLANGDCPGEGIGLTIVRKIVEKHGGRIWVESTPGAGATFWFSLETPPPASRLEVCSDT